MIYLSNDTDNTVLVKEIAGHKKVAASCCCCCLPCDPPMQCCGGFKIKIGDQSYTEANATCTPYGDTREDWLGAATGGGDEVDDCVRFNKQTTTFTGCSGVTGTVVMVEKKCAGCTDACGGPCFTGSMTGPDGDSVFVWNDALQNPPSAWTMTVHRLLETESGYCCCPIASVSITWDFSEEMNDCGTPLEGGPDHVCCVSGSASGSKTWTLWDGEDATLDAFFVCDGVNITVRGGPDNPLGDFNAVGATPAMSCDRTPPTGLSDSPNPANFNHFSMQITPGGTSLDGIIRAQCLYGIDVPGHDSCFECDCSNDPCVIPAGHACCIVSGTECGVNRGDGPPSGTPAPYANLSEIIGTYSMSFSNTDGLGNTWSWNWTLVIAGP